MKTKTIKKLVLNKLESWIDSIRVTNAKLADDLKNENAVIVSGGCITSMFLNEPVNDYDIYISDMDILIRLARHYCKGYRVLDGRKKNDYIADTFGREITEIDDHYNSEMYVRLYNLKEDQVKLDIVSEGIRLDINEEEVTEHDYIPVFFSQNAISLTNDIQIVLRFSGSVENIHKSFDFMHATNYFSFKDGLVTNKIALESILSKDLIYQGSLYPLTSIIRMKKFIGRGWRIDAGQILKIMFQISELNLKDIKVLEDQLIGVDVAYFSKLIAILREVKPDKIKSGYLNTIIDRVFNQYEEDENI